MTKLDKIFNKMYNRECLRYEDLVQAKTAIRELLISQLPDEKPMIDLECNCDGSGSDADGYCNCEYSSNDGYNNCLNDITKIVEKL
jgi:hypothetical protein